uniref:Putative kunitz n=1 Tax=Rhipicephalus microplus TaxID=6941 RepID=A0A6G5A6X9_RHIMP
MLVRQFVAVLKFFCCLEYGSGAEPEAEWVIKRPVACYMGPDYGLGKGHHERFFYNNSNKRCRPFDYSGSGGNGNNFDTKRECRYLCGSKYDPDRDPCLKPPSNIWCPTWPTYVEMWTFDKKTEKCIPFLYHQCAIDRNVFPTCHLCLKECQRHMHELQHCPE